jgi:hypothetical protein
LLSALEAKAKQNIDRAHTILQPEMNGNLMVTKRSKDRLSTRNYLNFNGMENVISKTKKNSEILQVI